MDDHRLRDLFGKGQTAIEIAAALGCSTHPVKKALVRLGLRRPANRREGVGAGSSNPAWKGGRRVRTDGYVAIWTPEGERLEHQTVMEKHLARRLKRGEIVHHRDHDKQNNAIENLQLMSQAEHARHHAPEMHKARYGK